jgi:hypothetical protein
LAKEEMPAALSDDRYSHVGGATEGNMQLLIGTELIKVVFRVAPMQPDQPCLGRDGGNAWIKADDVAAGLTESVEVFRVDKARRWAHRVGDDWPR